MTNNPSEPQGQLDLSYLTVSGEEVRTLATIGERADHVPAALLARLVVLADHGTEARQLVVDPAQRRSGYQQLDNEILAGRWLHRVARSARYPAHVSRLIGFVADSADPFALVEDYEGEPVSAAASHLSVAEQRVFQVSLMTGLRWLAEAGLVHCAIGPDTVRWDGDNGQAQITDFSLATVIGADRSAVSRPSRQGQGLRTGAVTDRDDVWAALLLCYYMQAGREFTGLGQLADWPAGGDLAADIKAGQDNCPCAHTILTDRLKVPDPVPLGRGSDSALAEGVDEFLRIRRDKHPGAPAFATAFGSITSGWDSASRATDPPGRSGPPVLLDPPSQDDEPAIQTDDDIALGRPSRRRPRWFR
jgi:hypothetical protein